jgi:hypothetical protein
MIVTSVVIIIIPALYRRAPRSEAVAWGRGLGKGEGVGGRAGGKEARSESGAEGLKTASQRRSWDL